MKRLTSVLGIAVSVFVFAGFLTAGVFSPWSEKFSDRQAITLIGAPENNAGFFRDLIKAISGAFESVFGKSSSGSGSGASPSPTQYVPPQPQPTPPASQTVGLSASATGVTLPNASTPKLSNKHCVTVARNVAANSSTVKLTDQGSALPGVQVSGAPLAEPIALDNDQSLKKNGEPAMATTGSFQVFIPTNSDTELGCFRGMPANVRQELSLTIAPCPPPPPPTTGGVWINVAGSGESQASACARIGSTPEIITNDGCGFCAAPESRPPLRCGNVSLLQWPSMPGRYQNNYSGGGIVAPGGRYCYKQSQKHDDDSTDRIVAWRCKDPNPPPPPTGTTSELVLSDCRNIN